MTVDAQPRSGITVTAVPGGQATTGPTGEYSLSVPVGSISVSVTPVSGVSFTPSSRTVVVSGGATEVVDFAGITDATFEERIVFASNRLGGDNYDVYSMRVDGTQVIPITDAGALDNAPRWSPDGLRLAFHSRRQQQGDRVWLMDRDGMNPSMIPTGGPSYSPTWAGDRLVYASRDGNRDIYSIGLDGSDEQRLTTVTGADQAPDWHPTRQEIVFQSERTGIFEIFVMSETGGPATNLSERGLRSVNPRWSPDGSQIAFASELSEGGAMEIFIMDADGSNKRPITGRGQRSRHPAWSPDGSSLAFQSSPTEGGDWDIYIVDVATGAITQITFDPADDEDPDWASVPS